MGKSTTREEIVEAGRQLFFRYGLKKVTVTEICTGAGVSKMTFYKYFPNKLTLAKTIMDGITEFWLKKYWDVMRSDASFAEKMHRFVEMKMEGTRDPSSEFILEMFRSDDPEISGYAENLYKRSISESVAMFTLAQEKGWMRRDLKPELLMALLNGMFQVVMDEKVIALYDNLTELTSEVIKFFLYGISDER